MRNAKLGNHLKARMSRAEVVVMTHAPSDVTAFLKAAASSILRSLLSALNPSKSLGEMPKVR